MVNTKRFFLAAWLIPFILAFVIISCGTPLRVITGQWKVTAVKSTDVRAERPDRVVFSGDTVEFYLGDKVIRTGTVKQQQIIGDDLTLNISETDKGSINLSGQVDGIATEYALEQK